MPHKNYYQIEAKNYFDLGYQIGQKFGSYLRQTVQWQKKNCLWYFKLLRRSRAYLAVTKRAFPYLVEELEGYAKGAKVSFEDLWLLSLEDELFHSSYEKCTSIIAAQGSMIAHNEDWDRDVKDGICVMKKTIGKLSILELFYLNTLGGNAISINSNGFVQTINTLPQIDKQIGVPKNVIARWISETENPERDFKKLVAIRRSSGYSHTVCSMDGNIWNLECSAKDQILGRPDTPFVHTNHFLSELGRLENYAHKDGTFARFYFASSKIKDSISRSAIKRIADDTSCGPVQSVFNLMTIARMIIDVNNMTAYIWLLREKEQGWVEYDLSLVLRK